MAANPYDPVTTTDSSQLTDDDWGLSLPPIKYNKYSSSRFKNFCFQVRQWPRCLFIAIGALALVILLIVIIVVASNNSERHPSGDEESWKKTDLGLEFYPIPEDKTILISFDPKEFGTNKVQPLVSSIQSKVKAYENLHQMSSPYVHCNSTYKPADGVCKVLRTSFGHECTSQTDFGYSHAQPCVFIQLVLPPDMTIAPVKKGDPMWDDEAENLIKGDNSDIPLTCDGKNPVDKDNLNDGKPLGKRIEYYPETGFPSYIYRPRNTTLPFLRPGVMVMFTSLLDQHLVYISCRAWGQLYNKDNKPVSHKPLEVVFAIYINHK